MGNLINVEISPFYFKNKELIMVEYKRIQLRRDTSENWHTENPVLLEGEIGVDLTNNNIKIGDGSTAWNDLDYVHSDVDLSDYYNKEETDDVVEGAKDALQSIIDTKVDNDTYQAKIGEIEGEIEGKADRTDIPSLNGYATEAWVEGKGYITEHQSLDDYYTKEEIDGKQQAIDNALATKADATETANRFNSVDEYLDTLHTEVEGKADVSSLENYVTKGEYEVKVEAIDNTLNEKADATETANRFNSVDEYLEQLHTEVEKKADAASVPTKTSELENDSNFLTEHQSLDNYYTKEETDTAIQGAKDALQDEINTKVDNDTYETKINEIEGVLGEKTTMAEVEAKGYLTEHQKLKTINGEEIVGEGDIEIKGGGGNNWYGTEEEFKALGEYDETGNTLYHIEGQIDFKTDIKNIPSIPKKVSQLPNDAHYIQDVKKINGVSMRGAGDVDIMKIIGRYHWWGTQEEYDAIEEKDANVQYHIEGEMPTETSTLIFELEDGTTKTIEVYIK